MMKRIFINAFWLLGKLCSFFYSYKISVSVNLLKMNFYSAWISREFKHFGRGSLIFSFNSFLGGKYISIGTNCNLGKRTVLTAWDKFGSDTFIPSIIIGNNVSIGDDSHISAINRIEIGNNVLTGKKITIVDNAHGRSNLESFLLPPNERPLYSEGPVIIEDGVWIGDKVTILPNVHIGKNAIIGANAVVTKDVQANSIVGGIPAKVLKQISFIK